MDIRPSSEPQANSLRSAEEGEKARHSMPCSDWIVLTGPLLVQNSILPIRKESYMVCF